MIESRLINLLDEVKEKLPVQDVFNIKEFIKHHEWGLAFEIMCTQLYEYDEPITHDFYEKISELGSLIEISSKIWTPLLELITE